MPDSIIKGGERKEIGVWVHLFVDNYAATPIAPAAETELRFVHSLNGGSFNYEKVILPWNGVTSYMNGYAVKPIIGKELRLYRHPISLPPHPYRLSVTYLMFR